MMHAQIKIAVIVVAILVLIGSAGTKTMNLLTMVSAASAAETAGKASATEDDWKPPKIPAFPGAEGYGAVSRGGRGGKVIKVTNLNPKGPGSLQWACRQDHPRIVIFEVSGVITPVNRSKGKNWLSIKKDRMTIAGQTAPGGGIVIQGSISSYRPANASGEDYGGKGIINHDLIMRFMRGRPISPGGGRGANLRGLEMSKSVRMILDHVSCSWSTDDCCCPGNRFVTIQWSAIEESDVHLEGDEPHNFAMLMSGKDPQERSIHHTLIANHRERTPACGTGPTDWRNNVIYNGGGGGFSYTKEPISIVGNYTKPGPAGLIGARLYIPPLTWGWPTLGFRKVKQVYVDGNYWDMEGGYSEPWKRGGKKPANVVAKDHDWPKVTTHTGEEAYELVLAHAGCLPRDAVGKRTIAEVRTRTGCRGFHGTASGLFEGLKAGKVPVDTDNDGMPDAWEKVHTLDPDDTSDGNKIVPAGASPGDRHKDYTYIEYYINELADLRIAEAMTKARLDRSPPKPWDKPADELSPGSTPHKSLDDIVKAISETTVEKKYHISPGWYAVQQLSRMGEKAKPAVAELAKIMEESNDSQKIAFAAWALGAIGLPAKEVIPAMIRCLEKEQNTKWAKYSFCPRGFIAWALGRIGPEAKEAAPNLAKLIHGKDLRARWPSVWALSRMGPGAEPAMAELLKVLDGGSQYTRAHAVDALAGIGEPAVQGLISAMRRAKGGSAAKALGLIGPKAKAAVPALTKALSSTDKRSRAQAALALGRIDPEAAAEAVVGLLTDQEYSVRHYAVRALGICGPRAASAISALEKALGDERKEIRRAAALALGDMGKAAVPTLIKAIKHESVLVRKYAARALGNTGDAGAVDALAKALDDKNAEVRRESVWSLALLGPTAGKASRILNKAAQEDPDYVVRYAAGEALKLVK